MKIRDRELNQLHSIGNEEAQDWIETNINNVVTCPNVRNECFNGLNIKWICPHSKSHKADQSCRFGICPITFNRLECN